MKRAFYAMIGLVGHDQPFQAVRHVFPEAGPGLVHAWQEAGPVQFLLLCSKRRRPVQKAAVGKSDDQRIDRMVTMIQPVLCGVARFLAVVARECAVEPERPAEVRGQPTGRHPDVGSCPLQVRRGNPCDILCIGKLARQKIALVVLETLHGVRREPPALVDRQVCGALRYFRPVQSFRTLGKGFVRRLAALDPVGPAHRHRLVGRSVV